VIKYNFSKDLVGNPSIFLNLKYIEGLFAKYPYKEIFRFFIKLQGRAGR